MKHKRIVLQITHTAVFLALLVVMQTTASLSGNTIITGSAVNFLLIVTVMVCGLLPGLTVSIVSPVIAKLLGIGPLWSLIPFIVLGNTVLTLVWHLIGNRRMKGRYTAKTAALVTAAAAKSTVLYLGIVRIAIPLLLNLPDTQAALISGMFSIPQLITALLGGLTALPLIAPLKKAIVDNRT